MDNKERLQKLKSLQITDENERTIFSKHKSLLAWIDNVSPLLKYNTQHYNTFVSSARTASAHLSSRTITYFLNIAKSTVNQAIIELENDIDLPIPNCTTKPTTDIANNKQNPMNVTLKEIVVGVIIIVLATMIIWIINHYFPFLNL